MHLISHEMLSDWTMIRPAFLCFNKCWLLSMSATLKEYTLIVVYYAWIPRIWKHDQLWWCKMHFWLKYGPLKYRYQLGLHAPFTKHCSICLHSVGLCQCLISTLVKIERTFFHQNLWYLKNIKVVVFYQIYETLYYLCMGEK